MIDHLVLDVEIVNTIDSLPNKWEDTHLMGVSCAVIYEYLTDRFRIYGPNDIEALISRLLKADKISGYNIYKFDYNVIWNKPSKERVEVLKAKTNDILDRIWRALGRFEKGWSLDNVCKETLGVGKIGKGDLAPIWYQEGRWDKVLNYCLDDVTLERDLVNFVDKYGYVICNENILYLDSNNWRPA